MTTTAHSGRQQGNRFSHLQTIQGENDPNKFQDELKRIALPVHAGFLMLCEEIGWPQPGISSSEDARQWRSGGDADVERIITPN